MNPFSEEIPVQFISLNVLKNVPKNQVMFGEQEFIYLCQVFVKPLFMLVLFKITEE
jgi:hypothetical protein